MESNPLETIMMYVSLLTHRFLQAGYLIRGEIDIGKVWHGEHTIVGPAYQEAYKIEADPANREKRITVRCGSNSVA
jgi:uncharacterized protein YqhQ